MEEDRVLTPEEVEQIRYEARLVNASYTAIAKKWNIERGHVMYIAKREDK